MRVDESKSNGIGTSPKDSRQWGEYNSQGRELFIGITREPVSIDFGTSQKLYEYKK